jgi:EpsD family peptidyl-prolyl cis-trans isomerase
MRKKIIFAIAIGLVATSCQKKPSGQSVAVVNNEEITAAELNELISREGGGAGANAQEGRAAALQKLVDRKLLVQQARKDGIDKTPEFLSQERRATEDLLINMLVAKRLNTAQVPTPQEIARFQAARPGMFQNREVWTLSQIVYPLPRDPAVTQKLNSAKTLDDLARILAENGIQFTRDTKKIDTGIIPHSMYQQISRLGSGETFIVPGGDRAVANVITAREAAPLSADQARALAINSMRREQGNQIMNDRVEDLRTSAKIQYQQGFGPPPKKAP